MNYPSITYNQQLQNSLQAPYFIHSTPHTTRSDDYRDSNIRSRICNISHHDNVFFSHYHCVPSRCVIGKWDKYHTKGGAGAVNLPNGRPLPEWPLVIAVTDNMLRTQLISHPRLDEYLMGKSLFTEIFPEVDFQLSPSKIVFPDRNRVCLSGFDSWLDQAH